MVARARVEQLGELTNHKLGACMLLQISTLVWQTHTEFAVPMRTRVRCAEHTDARNGAAENRGVDSTLRGSAGYLWDLGYRLYLLRAYRPQRSFGRLRRRCEKLLHVCVGPQILKGLRRMQVLKRVIHEDRARANLRFAARQRSW